MLKIWVLKFFLNPSLCLCIPRVCTLTKLFFEIKFNQNHLQGNIDIPNRFNTGSNASAINVNIRTSIKNCFHRGCFNFHSLNLFGFLARSYAPDFSPMRSVHQLGSTMFPNNFKSRINLAASNHQIYHS